MKKYIVLFFVVSVFLIIIGLVTGKISGDSFEYISITGSLFAILQILIVTVVLLIAAAITLPALLIDLIMLVFGGFDFNLIKSIWQLVWSNYAMGWFWHDTTGSSILFASIVILIITGLMLRKRR